MNITQTFLHRVRSQAFLLGLPALLSICTPAFGIDTDIFTINSTNGGPPPNVLIVLDNTSNWARQSQHWPGGTQQGQSEVNAIKTPQRS